MAKPDFFIITFAFHKMHKFLQANKIGGTTCTIWKNYFGHFEYIFDQKMNVCDKLID